MGYYPPILTYVMMSRPNRPVERIQELGKSRAWS